MVRSIKQSTARRLGSLVGGVLAIAFAGCASGGDEIGSGASQIDLNWGSDPCKGAVSTIVGHDHKFVGTDGDDVIVATEGDDEIWGNGGNDTICALGGEDIIHGGDGNDYIDGGDGNDTIDGGDGNDLIHGRGGSDLIHGGAGDDLLFGDILDDKIYGDDGNDILIGGHGVDHMDGGNGNDWLRGDTNGDDFIGGPGNDTASFETAMPPGQPEGSKASPNPINGVIVDFDKGTVSGDGVDEPLQGIERVIGSPFNDSFLHIGKSHTVVPGFGNDLCDGAPCGSGALNSGKTYVGLTTETRDLGLLIIGTTADDHIAIAPKEHTIAVTATDGKKLQAGHGCHAATAAATEIDCPIADDDALRFILGYGDAGDDRFELTGNLPRDITVHISGGEGDDTLIGGDEQDVFFTGTTGADILRGNGGDDALISESHDWDRARSADQYQGGGDTLDGGSGNDQLVVDYPCGGHHYIGGPGNDIAGFARSTLPLTAQLGGLIQDEKNRMTFYGRAFNTRCTDDWQTYATTMEGDLETLEGTDADDELHGNDADNVIWGRDGNDKLFGHGGDDVLSGALGSDILYGGTGHDKLDGGGDYDYLYANDGQADLELSCGDGGGELVTHDGNDPASSNCKVGGGAPKVGKSKPAKTDGGGQNGGGNGGGNTTNGGCGGDDFPLPGEDPNHCYRVITPRTWDEANAQCQAVNMHLATLTIAEDDALVASNKIGSATWIGGHRKDATKQFYWVKQDETFPGNAPWYDPQEANNPNGDKCVAVLQNGQWGLRSCDDAIQAVCEDF